MIISLLFIILNFMLYNKIFFFPFDVFFFKFIGRSHGQTTIDNITNFNFSVYSLNDARTQQD